MRLLKYQSPDKLDPPKLRMVMSGPKSPMFAGRVKPDDKGLVIDGNLTLSFSPFSRILAINPITCAGSSPATVCVKRNHQTSGAPDMIHHPTEKIN